MSEVAQSCPTLCDPVDCSLPGFPGGSVVKNLPANAGDAGSIPGSERYPEEGNGNPIQYSCLENSKDRGDWQATVQGVAESDTTEHRGQELLYYGNFPKCVKIERQIK